MQDDIRNREFLGQGWAFPLQVNQRGEIALAKGELDILQSIHVILETFPGERVMRPEFGCRAKELLFAPLNSTTRNEMIFNVKIALERWEPRIDLRDVDAYPDPERDGVLLVEIHYEIKSTHDVRSIVYPFYIMGED